MDRDLMSTNFFFCFKNKQFLAGCGMLCFLNLFIRMEFEIEFARLLLLSAYCFCYCFCCFYCYFKCFGWYDAGWYKELNALMKMLTISTHAPKAGFVAKKIYIIIHTTIPFYMCYLYCYSCYYCNRCIILY